MSSNIIQNRWSTCSREDQETVFWRIHHRCMVEGIGGVGGIGGIGDIWRGGGGKTIQIFFGDSSDVSFCQGVLGPGAGAMEKRCHLGDTKELAPVPGAEGSVAEASALSMLELARTSSFCPVCSATAMPPANLALSQAVLHHSRRQNAPTILLSTRALPASLPRGSDSSQQVFFGIRCIFWKTIANNKLFQDSWSHSFDLDLNTFCIL